MEQNLLLNRGQLLEVFRHLKPDTLPNWGAMTPQHMVEHLAAVLQFSNGKINAALAIPFEKAERAKSKMLSEDWEMPKGFKAAFLPEAGLPPLQFSSLEDAIHALFSEMADFYSFFAENPGARPIHPYFSDLDQGEWLTLHHKHFKHHFEQFGLC